MTGSAFSLDSRQDPGQEYQPGDQGNAAPQAGWPRGQKLGGRYARLWMSAVLLLADGFGMCLAGLLGWGLRYWMGELVDPTFYWNLLALIPVFLVVYALRGLYPAVGLGPVEELRRLSTATSAVFLVFTAFTFWVRIAEYFSRLIVAFAWAFALITVPLCRWGVRWGLARLGWWGEPVVVIGDQAQGQHTADFLLRRPRFGLRPVVLVSENVPSQPMTLPCLDLADFLAHPERLIGVHTAMLAQGEVSQAWQQALLDEQRFGFRRLILVTDLSWIGSLGVEPYDLEGLLGLEVRQNLLDPWHQRMKRMLDLGLTVLLSLACLPLIALLAVFIRLETPGRVFFRHSRVGLSGRTFVMLKFRTMVMSADQVLQAYLDEHPAARAEWQSSQKLKDDPRITRMGRFLRRTSLDELPQLWNVLRGEMSLVGPRPIIAGEVERYAGGYTLYQRVRPGITGLWQVSGRNDLAYAERVRLDEYYVRNWSIWLDLYILLRTGWAALSGEGAY
jgi:Undecaprenyl-phosphate galactose phosphotransferase WbaP